MLCHDPRIIMRHAMRLTKAMVPRSVCELQELTFASNYTIPSVGVTYGKAYEMLKLRLEIVLASSRHLRCQ